MWFTSVWSCSSNYQLIKVKELSSKYKLIYCKDGQGVSLYGSFWGLEGCHDHLKIGSTSFNFVPSHVDPVASACQGVASDLLWQDSFLKQVNECSSFLQTKMCCWPSQLCFLSGKRVTIKNLPHKGLKISNNSYLKLILLFYFSNECCSTWENKKKELSVPHNRRIR